MCDECKSRLQGEEKQIESTNQNTKHIDGEKSSSIVISKKTLFIIAVVIIVMAFGVVMLLKQKESNTTSTTEIGNVDNNDVVNEEPDSEYDASWIEKEKENDNFTESQTVHEDGADEHYPFYGVWIAATKDQFEAETMYNEFIAQGFDVQMVVTSEWSNLNRESYYAVSVGMHSSKESAKAQLKEVKRRGYESAYIKYSGNYLLD